MSFLRYGIFLTAPLLLFTGCNVSQKASQPKGSPTVQLRSFTVEENQFSFSYPAAWGEVSGERSGADIDCPPLAEGEPSICAVMGNTLKLSFSQKSDIILEFVSQEFWKGERYFETVLRVCPSQPKDEILLIDEKFGYCGKIGNGIITFSTLSPVPKFQGFSYLPQQLIFYPLSSGKFAGLTVYKTLPASEDCKKEMADGKSMALEDAKRCIQESMRMFSEAESTLEGKEFSQFLSELAPGMSEEGMAQ